MRESVMKLVALLLCTVGCLPFGSHAAVQNGSTATFASKHDGRCLGVEGNSAQSGARIQAQACNGSTNQQWRLQLDASGRFTMRNAASGLCLDVPGASTSFGTPLEQWGCSGGAWQAWNFNDDGAAGYYMTSVLNGLAIDYDYSSTTGTVLQWGYAGNNNQRWTMNVIAGGGPAGFAQGTTGGAGGSTVTVTSPAQLAAALCASTSGGLCTDATPRIIKISGMLDFRGTEGQTTQAGCIYSHNNCSVNGRSERILDYASYCSGRTTFPITFDTAGVRQLLVGSNKTIIGVGAGSGIRGKGFTLKGGVSNIIIRNLAITDINDGVIWAGDALTLDNTSKVWIDHNHFARIGRQMIVAGWGTAKNVTISGNHFDGTTDYGHYCNGKAYWIMLLVGDNQSISLIGNRISNTSGRSPKLGKPEAAATGGIVHVANNFYEGNYSAGGLTGDINVNALIEGNYYSAGTSFYPVYDPTPAKTNTNSNWNYTISTTNAASADQSCISILGRQCRVNFDATGRAAADFLLNPNVMSAVQGSPDALHVIRAFSPIDSGVVPAQKFGPQADIVP